MKSAKCWMKVWSAMAIAAGLAVPAAYGQLYNQTQVVDGVTWTYSVENGTATITGAAPGDGDLVIPSFLGTYPVTRIGDHMSWERTSYFVVVPTTVTIPSSVTNIGDSVNCECLTQIVVEPDNKHYASKDGVLFSKSGDVLIQFPIRREGAFTIPSSVTSIGISAFSGCTDLTAVTIPNSVTNIGAWAFCYCTNLTSLTIPDSVTSIGRDAFSYCNSLETLYVPESWKSKYASDSYPVTFWSTYAGVPAGCTVVYYSPQLLLTLTANQQTVSAGTLDNQELGVVANVAWTAKSSSTWLKLKTSGGNGNGTIVYDLSANTGADSRTGTITVSGKGIERTFKVSQGVWCYEISDGNATVTGANPAKGTLVIPSSLGGCPVTSIGFGAFRSCHGLTSVTIPDSVTDIGEEAFQYCWRLTSVTIPPSVTSIEFGVFEYCGLTTVCIPSEMTNIGSYAFSGCRALTSVAIPSNVTYIGFGAFQGCGLTSVTIPASVTDLWEAAFRCCGNLTNIMVEAGNTNYVVKDGVLFSASLLSDGQWELHGLVCYPGGKTDSSYTIPSGVGSIWEGAFQGARLTSVTIPSSVHSIQYGAFLGCGLTSLTIHSGLETIEDYAFTGCSELTTLTIPASVITIGCGMFSGCDGLKTLYAPESWRSKYVEGEFWSSYAGVPEGCNVVYGSPPSQLTLAADSRSVTAAAVSSQELGVTANVAWTAQSSASWLTLKTPSGSGNGTILYNVAANPGTASRTGTITVTGGGITCAFTVTQDGAEPMLSLAADSQSFTASAANGQQLGVSANVAWTAQSSASWLTVKTASGNGNGTILYDVSANAGTDARTGTITVSGGGLARTFTVTQGAADPGSLPEVADVSGVVRALEGAVDGRLKEEITDVETYGEFREWALGTKGSDGKPAGAKAVLASEHAWTSWRLGAETLLGSEPKIQLGGVAVGRAATKGGGSVVAVDVDVTVTDGGKTVFVDAGKVAGLFEASEDLGEWNATASATRTGGEGTTVRFRVVPGGTADTMGFLRLGLVREEAKRPVEQ